MGPARERMLLLRSDRRWARNFPPLPPSINEDRGDELAEHLEPLPSLEELFRRPGVETRADRDTERWVARAEYTRCRSIRVPMMVNRISRRFVRRAPRAARRRPPRAVARGPDDDGAPASPVERSS